MTSSLQLVRPETNGPRFVQLSWREIDVLRAFLRDGADTATVAHRVEVSENTAKSHMRVLYRKFGVFSRSALAVEILRGRSLVIDPRGQRCAL